MNSVSVVFRVLVVVIAGLVCAGCWNAADRSLDEQKDPNVIHARNLANNLDYEGAAAAYEKALEANPQNATAHFELCWLHEQKLHNYAAAVYHGERFLKLRPESEYADIVRQHIEACKQELGKSFAAGPVIPAIHGDIVRVSAENKALREQVKTLSEQLAIATNMIARMTAASSRQPAVQPQPIQPAVMSPTPVAQPTIHHIKSGDTYSRLARTYGVKVQDLIAENPGLDPRRLKIGQPVKIPTP